MHAYLEWLLLIGYLFYKLKNGKAFTVLRCSITEFRVGEKTNCWGREYLTQAGGKVIIAQRKFMIDIDR